MSQPLNRFLPRQQLRRGLLGLMALAVLTGWLLMPGRAQVASESQLARGANYKQAYKYSPEFLRQFVYSTAVQPTWIGKTDSFWYQYNTRDLAGWVTQGNPYAQPAAYVSPDWGVVLLHLKAKT